MISALMCECALYFPMYACGSIEVCKDCVCVCVCRISALLQVNKRRIESSSRETQRLQTISQSSEPKFRHNSPIRLWKNQYVIIKRRKRKQLRYRKSDWEL